MNCLRLSLLQIDASFVTHEQRRDLLITYAIICGNINFQSITLHWLGAYRTNALYSGHIFVRFNDLEDVFT